MQAQNPSGGPTEASTQPSIKRYLVKESWKDYEVTLEVNHDVLTEDIASQINGFLSEAQHRVSSENGDVVKAVIRLFGKTMIGMMLSEGGSSFSPNSQNSPFGNPGPIWTADLQNEEGWGGTVEGSPYGWCGIRVIGADVDTPGFDDVELSEVPHA